MIVVCIALDSSFTSGLLACNVKYFFSHRFSLSFDIIFSLNDGLGGSLNSGIWGNPFATIGAIWASCLMYSDLSVKGRIIIIASTDLAVLTRMFNASVVSGVIEIRFIVFTNLSISSNVVTSSANLTSLSLALCLTSSLYLSDLKITANCSGDAILIFDST